MNDKTIIFLAPYYYKSLIEYFWWHAMNIICYELLHITIKLKIEY